MSVGKTHDVESIRKTVKRIKSVDDTSPHVKACVYGSQGSGKTRFAASAPNCLILSVQEPAGTRSAVGSGARVIEIEEWPEFGDVYWYYKRGKHKYESLAIDGLTGMQNLCMDFVLNEAEGRKQNRVRGQPTMQDFGRCKVLMVGMLSAFLGLPAHIVFTALPRAQFLDKEREILDSVTIDLPAGSRGTALSVAIVGFMEPREVRKRDKAGKVRRVWEDRMRVGKDTIHKSLKDRTNRLGDYVDKPNMATVIEAWNDYKKEQD
jgi:hypothetical protein